MQLSTILFICIFVCCATGVFDEVCRKNDLSKGAVAAMSVLVLAVSAFQLPAGKFMMINPACVLLIFVAALLVRGTKDACVPVLLALGAAIFSWILYNAFPKFPETGLLVALPACCISLVLKQPRRGLACVLLSPFFFGCIALIEDWYLFELFQIPLGSDVQLDAQVCGGILSGLIRMFPFSLRRTGKRRTAA